MIRQRGTGSLTRIRAKGILVVLLLLASIAPRPRAFGAQGDWSAEKARRLESALEAERIRQRVVGMTAAVSQNGQLRWINAFGKADLEQSVAAKRETVYRLASISKPITAVAAMQLAERGRLDLDAPVQTYVPAFPAKQWPVTVRLLLSHLSGLRGYRGDEMGSVVSFSNVVEPLRIFAADPLIHEPRSKYLYSTYGFNLVGAVVESAAGVPFLDYLGENVFKPAKMETIRDDDRREIILNRARGYSKSADGIIVNCPLADTSNKIPGGGMAATAYDLIHFAAAFDSGLLLQKKSMAEMLMPQRLLDGRTSGYGLGWNISPIGGRRAVSHGGAQQGCRTMLALFPDSKITIVILTNSDYAIIGDFVAVVWRALDAPSSAW